MSIFKDIQQNYLTKVNLATVSGIVPMGSGGLPPNIFKDEKWSSEHLCTDALRSTTMLQSCLSDVMEVMVLAV